MAVTLLDIRTSVRKRIEQPTSVRFSDADLNGIINEALEELSESTEFYETSVTVPLKANRTYYDLRAILPSTFLSVTDVWHSGYGWLIASGIREMGFVEWEKAAGTPFRWFLRGLWWLGVYPHMASDTGTMTIYYTAVTPALVNDGDAIPFPDDYADVVEDYVLYELEAREGETPKALTYWQSYQEGEKELRDYVLRRVVDSRHSRMASRRR